MDILKEVQERLSKYNKLYDFMRVVDPVAKKTILFDEEGKAEPYITCYDFWKGNSFCENCISMKAFLEEDTIIKLEHNEDNIFFVIAAPVTIEGRKYVVELLKDMSREKRIINGDINLMSSINELINEINEKAVKDEVIGIYK